MNLSLASTGTSLQDNHVFLAQINHLTAIILSESLKGGTKPIAN